MFFLRGVIIALAVFGILYIGGAGAIAALVRWLPLRRWNRAGALFLLRTLPLWAAAVVVLLLTVPSFVYLEPRENAEPVGTFAWLAAVLAAGVFAAGALRAVDAALKAGRFRRRFLEGSEPIATASGLRAYVFTSDEPVLLVTGLLHPTVLVSSAAV